MNKLNVFIVAENALIVNGLKHYLKKEFQDIEITNFYDSRSCLRKIDKQTQVVIVDDFIHGRSGIEALRSIKTINPEIEVVMHSSREEVASYLHLYCRDRENLLKQKAN